MSLNSFSTKKMLTVGDETYQYFSLPEAQAQGLGSIDRLPMSLKILLGVDRSYLGSGED